MHGNDTRQDHPLSENIENVKFEINLNYSPRPA
jgi:hypothetical protein